VSTGVLIAGTWLAAYKASFINLTLNVTSSEISPASSSDAGKILKVLSLYLMNWWAKSIIFFFFLSLGVCWASCNRAGSLHSHCSWSFPLHHLLPWILWGYQGVQGASHSLWHLSHHHICYAGFLIWIANFISILNNHQIALILLCAFYIYKSQAEHHSKGFLKTTLSKYYTTGTNKDAVTHSWDLVMAYMSQGFCFNFSVGGGMLRDAFATLDKLICKPNNRSKVSLVD
jgi:hypothetical protein